jgi:hypothetical protein
VPQHHRALAATTHPFLRLLDVLGSHLFKIFSAGTSNATSTESGASVMLLNVLTYSMHRSTHLTLSPPCSMHTLTLASFEAAPTRSR